MAQLIPVVLGNAPSFVVAAPWGKGLLAGDRFVGVRTRGPEVGVPTVGPGLGFRALVEDRAFVRGRMWFGSESVRLSTRRRRMYDPPNKAPEATTLAVTPPAEPGVAPARVVPHL